MPVFPWTDLLSIGIKEIDDQHKKLVGLFNELGDQMKVGKGETIIGETLTNLLSYTQYHFTSEENLMRSNGYPEYEEHKAEHDALTSRVKEIQEQFKDKAYVVTRVMRLLREWLFDHISEKDSKIGVFLKERGIN